MLVVILSYLILSHLIISIVKTREIIALIVHVVWVAEFKAYL